MILVLNNRIHATAEGARRYAASVSWAAGACGIAVSVVDDEPKGLEQVVGAVAAMPNTPAIYTGAFLSHLHERGAAELGPDAKENP